MAAQRQPDTGRIVVGIDGSPCSLEALAWAVRQAELTGDRLEVVETWLWPTSFGWAAPIPDHYDPETEVRRQVESVVEGVRAEHPGVDVDVKVVEGHPAPVLVEESKGGDLLVVGSRGHGEFVGMLIGSVSEYCVAHADCPVVVHRPAS